MAKKRGLGLGLSELLSDIQTISTTTTTTKATESSINAGLRHLSIDLLKPGKYQPRRGMDKKSLEELAESIRTQGIIQPIVVRPIKGGGYEIIAGERRWRAAQLAKMQEVPVVTKEMADEQALAVSLIENIQREELNAIDTALSLQRLINEFSMTHENAALAIGKSRSAVTNLLRLLELADEIKEMVQEGALEMGHARALLTLEVTKRTYAAKIISSKKMSVRDAEKLVRQLQNPPAVKSRFIDPNTSNLQRDLADKLAAKVDIQHSKKGSGKIVIKYNNLDELDGILKHIK